MTRSKSQPQPPLVAAALAVEDALTRFEALGGAAGRAKLQSQKQIMRLAADIESAAVVEGQFTEALQTLSAAFQGAHQRYNAVVETIRERAVALQSRSEELGALADRLRTVGEESRAVIALVQAATPTNGTPPPADLPDQLEQVLARLDTVIGSAQALADEARERDAEDLTRQAVTLRTDLQTARRKLETLQKKLARLA